MSTGISVPKRTLEPMIWLVNVFTVYDQTELVPAVFLDSRGYAPRYARSYRAPAGVNWWTWWELNPRA